MRISEDREQLQTIRLAIGERAEHDFMHYGLLSDNQILMPVLSSAFVINVVNYPFYPLTLILYATTTPETLLRHFRRCKLVLIFCRMASLLTIKKTDECTLNIDLNNKVHLLSPHKMTHQR